MYLLFYFFQDLKCHKEKHAINRISEISKKKKETKSRVKDREKEIESGSPKKKLWEWREMVSIKSEKYYLLRWYVRYKKIRSEF